MSQHPIFGSGYPNINLGGGSDGGDDGHPDLHTFDGDEIKKLFDYFKKIFSKPGPPFTVDTVQTDDPMEALDLIGKDWFY